MAWRALGPYSHFFVGPAATTRLGRGGPRPLYFVKLVKGAPRGSRDLKGPLGPLGLMGA